MAWFRCTNGLMALDGKGLPLIVNGRSCEMNGVGRSWPLREKEKEEENARGERTKTKIELSEFLFVFFFLVVYFWNLVFKCRNIDVSPMDELAWVE